ncbi:hypothetical protein LCGC14_2768140 [marine sediment metagenome]|uniref:Uncharacterized protein n=1 Tax=marine sediment metagenome TaxID=412755 RepID=A0A0F8YWX8_9ZZZZ
MKRIYSFQGSARITLKGTATVISLDGAPLATLDLSGLPTFEADFEHSKSLDAESGEEVTLSFHVPVTIVADRLN